MQKQRQTQTQSWPITTITIKLK